MQISKLAQEYNKYLSTIDYYEKSAIPQANLIIDHATKSYKAGEIGYFEYLQNLNNAIRIKTEYFDWLMHYNQTVITIEQLTGGN